MDNPLLETLKYLKKRREAWHSTRSNAMLLSPLFSKVEENSNDSNGRLLGKIYFVDNKNQSLKFHLLLLQTIES